jgi:hypothetical protein|nr:MAG TPA: hypothetical protein [Caudoviricetes sp.]
MNNFIEIKHINEGEVNYLVRNLEDFEKDKAIKSGLIGAGQVFRSGGRSRLRRTMKSGNRGVTGNLLRSFIVKAKRNKPGVLTGFKQGVGGGSHAHLVDRGTAERYLKKKNNKSVGKVKPSFFWTDTESQDYPKAIDKLYDGIERAVERINNRR